MLTLLRSKLNLLADASLVSLRCPSPAARSPRSAACRCWRPTDDFLDSTVGSRSHGTSHGGIIIILNPKRVYSFSAQSARPITGISMNALDAALEQQRDRSMFSDFQGFSSALACAQREGMAAQLTGGQGDASQGCWLLSVSQRKIINNVTRGESGIAVMLEQRHLDLIRAVLNRSGVTDAHGAVIFGSRATGQARRFSDVDLGFAGDPVGARQLHEIVEELEESDLPMEVDVVNLSTVGARLQRHALADAVPLGLAVGSSAAS